MKKKYKQGYNSDDSVGEAMTTNTNGLYVKETIQDVAQYSYMAVIANSYQSHIYKMLIGSLNYVFSLVGSSLFRYEDDDETLKIVRDQILIYFLKRGF